MSLLSPDAAPAGAAPAGCFAHCDGGIVTIGNRRLVRRWKLTEQGLVPLSLALDGAEFLAGAPAEGPGMEPAGWRTFPAPLTRTGAPALHAVLEYALPGIGRIVRHFAVAADTPAVTVERLSSAPESVPASGSGTSAGPTGLEVDPGNGSGCTVEREAACESFRADTPHLRLREYRFADQTDCHDNLLTLIETRLAVNEPLRLRGVLFGVENVLTRSGVLLLKLAPLPERRPLPDEVDFEWDTERFFLHGDRYPWAVIGYSGGIEGTTRELQRYQRDLRRFRSGCDGVALSNTWGDRNRDQALNENFMLGEIAIAAELGIDVCQIDDGWQAGVTVNSSRAAEAGGGVWEGYHSANPGFWQVHPERFPHGLDPLVRRGRELGVGLGLWFSPDSSDDFANIDKDLETVCRFEREFGVDWIKIDGVKSRTRRGEANLRRFFEQAMERTGGRLVFDLDVTAEIRPGYFGMPEFGTLFVENRYSDWHRWWPSATFRNLWQLSRAIPPVRLRFECLNPERNREKYRNDPLAPCLYPMDWIFFSVMAASPLIWCELGSLSERCRNDLKRIIPLWRKYREELYSGVTLPVGPCPDGTTTSGFLAVPPDGSFCHLLLLRDLDPESEHEFRLPFSPADGRCEFLAGTGGWEAAGGTRVRCSLPGERSYLWLRFSRN